MEWIQSLIDSGTIPIVTALLLGLLTAISPCPLATNITAIGYISRDIENRHRIFLRGIFFTLGKIVVYAGLGFILIPILRQGASVFAIQKVIAKYGEMILAPALIIIGLFMLFGDRLRLPKFGLTGNSDKVKSRGIWGSLLLGILFSLAFCPSSGVIYFGMLIPMSAAESGGYLLPVVYAIATGLPVIVVAWILAYSIGGIGQFYSRLKVFQKWMNLAIALLFIAVGIYYLIILL